MYKVFCVNRNKTSIFSLLFLLNNIELCRNKDRKESKQMFWINIDKNIVDGIRDILS